jgi:hypothetical protein
VRYRSLLTLPFPAFLGLLLFHYGCSSNDTPAAGPVDAGLDTNTPTPPPVDANTTQPTGDSGADAAVTLLAEDYAAGCTGWVPSASATIGASDAGHAGPGACMLCRTAGGDSYVVKKFPAAATNSFDFTVWAQTAPGTETGDTLLAALRSRGSDGGILDDTNTTLVLKTTWGSTETTGHLSPTATELEATIDFTGFVNDCVNFDDVVLVKH